MQLLYGTSNEAKMISMQSRLKPLGISLMGLKNLKAQGFTIPVVVEDGKSPLENAEKKARAYYQAFQTPVFSCDSGLYFQGVPDAVQPGVHVRNVNGKCLSDQEMIEYYTGLVKQYGKLRAKYKNAICLVMDESHIYKAMEPSMESSEFWLTDCPHSAIREKGFPLDSLSIDLKTGQYFYDMPRRRWEQIAVENGFLSFFQKIFEQDLAIHHCYPDEVLQKNLSQYD